MAYKYSFLDNETYGVSDINRAFSAMTSAGVLPYTQTSTIAADFDAAAAATFIEGVGYFGESLRVYKTDNTHIFINNGNAIFASGAMIFVDSDGISLEFTPDSVNYVYIEHNDNLNYIQPKVSLSAPPQGAIPLATISQDGIITDTRTFGMTRYIPNSANVYKTFECPLIRNGSSFEGTVDIGSTVFTRIIIDDVVIRSLHCMASSKNTALLIEGQTLHFGWEYTSGGNDFNINVTKNGTVLSLSITGNIDSTGIHTVSLEVI